MSPADIEYCQPRVMRHLRASGAYEYAIHDVYFSTIGQPVTWTEAAISSREVSVASLKASLQVLANDDEVVLGDLGYSYSSEDIQSWLMIIDLPPIDFDAESTTVRHATPNGF